MPPQNQTTPPITQNNDSQPQPLHPEPSGPLETNTHQDPSPKKQQRINRLTFIASFLLSFIFTYFSLFLYAVLLSTNEAPESNNGTSLVGLILLFVVLIYLLLVYLRSLVFRCRDIGISPWFILLILVPLVNLIVLLFLVFKPGQVSANNYGESHAGLRLKRVFLFAKK